MAIGLNVKCKWLELVGLHEAELRIYTSLTYGIGGSDDCVSPSRYQAIVWSNDIWLSFSPMGIHFSEVYIKYNNAHSTKCIGIWNLQNVGHIFSALYIIIALRPDRNIMICNQFYSLQMQYLSMKLLMAFSTRASVTTVLSTHSRVSARLWVNTSHFPACAETSVPPQKKIKNKIW